MPGKPSPRKPALNKAGAGKPSPAEKKGPKPQTAAAPKQAEIKPPSKKSRAKKSPAKAKPGAKRKPAAKPKTRPPSKPALTEEMPAAVPEPSVAQTAVYESPGLPDEQPGYEVPAAWTAQSPGSSWEAPGAGKPPGLGGYQPASEPQTQKQMAHFLIDTHESFSLEKRLIEKWRNRRARKEKK